MKKCYNNYVAQLIKEKDAFIDYLVFQSGYKRESSEDCSYDNQDVSILSEFFDICNFLNITPEEFFEKSIKYPDLFKDIITELVLSILSKLNDKIK